VAAVTDGKARTARVVQVGGPSLTLTILTAGAPMAKISSAVNGGTQ